MDEDSSSEKEETPQQSWWEQRSDLEKVLLISLATVTVLIIGIVLYTSIKPTGTTETCITPGCLLEASQIISNVDSTIDPCEDFFKFACGKRVESKHGDLELAGPKVLGDQLKRKMAEIIEEPVNDNDHQTVKNQKALFQACMDEDAVEKKSLGILNGSLQELNGWPVVVGHAWKDNLFDWTDMMIKLRSRGYAYSMILHINIIYRNEFRVHIEPPCVPKMEGKDRELYKQYMIDTAVAFGAKQRRAEEDMQKVLDFMENLEKIAKINQKQDNETEFPSQTVEKFQLYEYEIEWLDLINSILGPDHKISQNDSVVFPKQEFLDDLFDLIDTTPKRIQANYMIWKVVESVIHFLSKELKELQENYFYLSKMGMPWKDRFDLCVSVLRETFITIPTVITYARKYLPTEKRQQAQELFGNIKSEFVELIGETTWMDDGSKEKTLKKADEMTDIIGTHGDYFDDAIFQDVKFNSKLINMEGYPFFTMYLNASKTYQDALFSMIRLSTENPVMDWFDHNVLGYHRVLYLAKGNVLVVPVAFLEESFHPDRPAYVNYGSLGYAIGTGLTEGFSVKASFYDKDGKENSLWTNETRKGYKEYTKCISDSDSGITKNKTGALITPDETIAEITGLKLSYAAYQKWVDQNGEELALMGIDYTPNQLFWISAMSYRCSKFNVQELQQIFDDYAQMAFEINAFLRNNPDFANDFGCAANSKMNPSEKCEVF